MKQRYTKTLQKQYLNLFLYLNYSLYVCSVIKTKHYMKTVINKDTTIKIKGLKFLDSLDNLSFKVSAITEEKAHNGKGERTLILYVKN